MEAIKQLKEIKRSAPVGLLTCDNRDAWAISREHLLVLDPKNRESLQVIEDALFCVTLDSAKEATKADRKTDYAEWAKFGMHGHGGHNRWCDKSMNLIFERDGKFLCHGEVKSRRFYICIFAHWKFFFLFSHVDCCCFDLSFFLSFVAFSL